MVKQSRYPFEETVSRLSAEVIARGAQVFATIDQAEAARGAGLSLRPTTLIVFGNPLGGTPLMDSAPMFALELPVKLLVWEEDGVVSVAYVPMPEVAQRYGISADDPHIVALNHALEVATEAVA